MSEHDCETCAKCIHDGRKCCGCYDGACCLEDEPCLCGTGFTCLALHIPEDGPHD